jgi:hypothetical protein
MITAEGRQARVRRDSKAAAELAVEEAEYNPTIVMSRELRVRPKFTFRYLCRFCVLSLLTAFHVICGLK